MLYIILSENGLSKIGISGNPKGRFLGLRTMSPVGLELLLVADEENDRAVERYLHSVFKNKRVRSEWFALDCDDLVFVSEYLDLDSETLSGFKDVLVNLESKGFFCAERYVASGEIASVLYLVREFSDKLLLSLSASVGGKSDALPRIRITPQMKIQLDFLAAADGRTVSDYVRLVLKQHLKSVECLQKLRNDEGGVVVWLDNNGET